MALEIKAIPTLKGREAKRFVQEADKAYQNKGKTDFSKQVKIARAILKKPICCKHGISVRKMQLFNIR